MNSTPSPTNISSIKEATYIPTEMPTMNQIVQPTVVPSEIPTIVPTDIRHMVLQLVQQINPTYNQPSIDTFGATYNQAYHGTVVKRHG